jgi:molybdate transport system substrate-binding protein
MNALILSALRTRTLLLAIVALACLIPSSARAEDARPALRVLSAGAMRSVLEAVLPTFEKQSGQRVAIEFGPAGEITRRVAAGDRFDLLIVPAESIETLAAQGHVDANTKSPLGRVGIGVAVKADAPSPDISTADALKRTLLAAKSIAYTDPTRGTSGKHFAQVLEKLGIADQMKPKTTLISGGYAADPVGRGEVELGIQQISEILPVAAVKLVGPLPPELQKWTTYTAVRMTGAPTSPKATDLVTFLTSPETRSVLEKRGISAP